METPCKKIILFDKDAVHVYNAYNGPAPNESYRKLFGSPYALFDDRLATSVAIVKEAFINGSYADWKEGYR